MKTSSARLPANFVGGLILLISLCFAPQFVQAENPVRELTVEEQRRATTLNQELKCPVCKSQSVAASTSFLAEQMKDQIRDLIRQGYSDEEVVNHFVARYGSWILMQPETTGSGILAWALPVFFVAIASVWLMFLLRRWSTGAPEKEADLA